MDNKEKYRRKMQEQLDQWKADLERLKQEAAVVKKKAVENLPEQITELEQKIEEGTARLKVLAETNEESWEALKGGFDEAWKSLSTGFREAKEKFKWEKEK